MSAFLRRFTSAVLAVAMVAVVSAVSDEKFGAGVKLTEATAIKALYEKPETFVGKTIRLDGVVTAVCEDMGCWLAIAPADAPDQAVRFKVDHEAGIVFPLSVKGKKMSAEGVFEKIATGDKEGQEAAGEHGSTFGKKYQIKATGAVVIQ